MFGHPLPQVDEGKSITPTTTNHSAYAGIRSLPPERQLGVRARMEREFQTHANRHFHELRSREHAGSQPQREAIFGRNHRAEIYSSELPTMELVVSEVASVCWAFERGNSPLGFVLPVRRVGVCRSVKDGLMPKESSRGTSKGSLKRIGELHRRVRLVRTKRATSADMYLKKLLRSWSRLGEFMWVSNA